MISRRSNGHHEAHARIRRRRTGRRSSTDAALEDPDDPPFGPVVAGALDARDDAVAVHRLIQVAAGDEDVAADPLDRPVRDDEAEAARMRLTRPTTRFIRSGRPNRLPRV